MLDETKKIVRLKNFKHKCKASAKTIGGGMFYDKKNRFGNNCL